MSATSVNIPTWLFLLLVVAAAYSVVMSILYPGVRWLLRRRLNQAVDRLNTSLHIKIRPLQRTKREVMIDQLIFDQEILALIEERAQQENVPRDELQLQVRNFAREIVPWY
ncbi:MAG: hypothetical protein AAB211_08515 [Pseudomonadota bacterium]